MSLSWEEGNKSSTHDHTLERKFVLNSHIKSLRNSSLWMVTTQTSHCLQYYNGSWPKALFINLNTWMIASQHSSIPHPLPMTGQKLQLPGGGRGSSKGEDRPEWVQVLWGRTRKLAQKNPQLFAWKERVISRIRKAILAIRCQQPRACDLPLESISHQILQGHLGGQGLLCAVLEEPCSWVQKAAFRILWYFASSNS